MTPDEKSLQRFEKFIDKHAPNGCWLWTGALDQRGTVMTRTQICNRAVFLSSVCRDEKADQAINEWLDVDAAQRQVIEQQDNENVELRRQITALLAKHDAELTQYTQAVDRLEAERQAVEGSAGRTHLTY
jgi:hypothetical protein